MSELKRLNGFGNFDQFGGYYDAEAVDSVIAEKDREIARWKDCRDECERQFQAKVEEVSDLLNSVAAKDKEIADLKKKLVEYEDCAANACAERDDNQAAIDELTAENESMRKQLAQVRAIVG